MRRIISLLTPLLLAALATLAVASEKAPTVTEETFEQVLQKRCTVCHTRERIDVARQRGADLPAIEKKMLSHGAQLSEQDRSVLGTFWGSPLKKKK